MNSLYRSAARAGRLRCPDCDHPGPHESKCPETTWSELSLLCKCGYSFYPADREPDVRRYPPCCAENADGVEPSWPELDARGIYLCRVCEKCQKRKLSRYRPEILSGYDQSDVPIEPQ